MKLHFRDFHEVSEAASPPDRGDADAILFIVRSPANRLSRLSGGSKWPENVVPQKTWV